MKIGIIGAESTHSVNYAKIINVKNLISECEVTHIWGETKSFAKNTADEGHIKCIVNKPEDMLDQVDAIIIAHRKASDHYEPAKQIINAGVPLFVDKPFTYTTKKGIHLLELASKNKIPITSFSNTILQENFKEIKAEINKSKKVFNLTIHGFCDINSPYDGIYFYGMHHVAMALDLIESPVKSVFLHNNTRSSCANLIFENGSTAQLIFMSPDWKSNAFQVITATETGTTHYPIISDQENYLSAIKLVVEMFKTKVMPFSPKQILKPIQILEALQKSSQIGHPIELESINI